MLRRDSTRSKRQMRGLSRSRSSCSTHTAASAVDSFSHIDPITARRDAHIAALISYSRSQRGSSETDNHTDMSIYETAMSRLEETMGQDTPTSGRVENDAPRLYRRQSIRYIGPGTGRPLGTGSFRAEPVPRISESTVRPSSCTRFPISQPATLSKPTLDRIDRSTFGEDSPPHREESSPHLTPHRRVRKAKSMFASLAQPRSSYHFNNEPPKMAGTSSHRGSLSRSFSRQAMFTHQADEASRARAPTSMSFLRNKSHGPDVPNRGTSLRENDLAIRMAEDMFREDIEHQRELAASNSSIFRNSSLRKRTDPRGTMRRTFRSGSISSADVAPVSHSTNSKFRQRARNVSHTLKQKIKDVFNLQRVTTVPASVTASDPHPPRNNEVEDEKYLTGPAVLSYKDEPSISPSISQGPSRVPALYKVPSDQQLRSSRGSVDSVGTCQSIAGGEEESVRILSWTTSGANSTDGQAQPPLVIADPTGSEFERQRLSVIKENGAHVATPSIHRKPSGGLYPDQEDINTTPCAQKRLTPDSRRLCSALVKRWEETNGCERGPGNPNQSDMEGYNPYSFSSPLDTSVCQGLGPGSSPTIRCVTPAMYALENTTTPKDLHRRQSWSILHQSPSQRRQRSGSISTPMVVGQLEDGATVMGDKSVEKHNTSPRPDLGQPSPTKEFTDRSSVFFGSPSCHLFRTTSPYRRALREKMGSDQASEHHNRDQDTQLGVSTSELSLPARCQSTQPSQRDALLDFTGSVYSDEGEEGGGREAYRVESRSASPRVPDGFLSRNKPRHLSSQVPPASSAVSTNWKTRLASGIERLKATSTSASRRKGHINEATAIDDHAYSSSNYVKLMPEALRVLGLTSGTSTSSPPDSVRISPRNDVIREEGSNSQAPVDERPGLHDPTNATSPLYIRPLNTHRLQNSSVVGGRDDPAKKEQLHPTEAASVVSSPGLTRAVEKMLGSWNGGLSSENTVPKGLPLDASQSARSRYSTPRPRDSQHIRVSTGRGPPSHDTNTNGQADDSRRMVDLFLNSRRRRVAGSEESAAFL